MIAWIIGKVKWWLLIGACIFGAIGSAFFFLRRQQAMA